MENEIYDVQTGCVPCHPTEMQPVAYHNNPKLRCVPRDQKSGDPVNYTTIGVVLMWAFAAVWIVFLMLFVKLKRQ